MTARTASAHAPGRIELLGNHTDYNEGFVLGAAIDRGVTVSGNSRSDGWLRLHSRDHGSLSLPLAELAPQPEQPWTNYVLGVADELRTAGVPLTGADMEFENTLPIGAGLSSSAALELASALLLLKLFPQSFRPLEIARLCQRAEHGFAGVPSGLFDQVTSLCGRANHAVFFDARSAEVQLVPFPPGLALLVADSGEPRALTRGEYTLRREETAAAAKALGVPALRDVALPALAEHPDLPPLLRRRAAHVVGENERVLQALLFLKAGNASAFGALMNASHESSRTNFENSTPRLDALVEIARDLPGVFGARLTGAGFGGAIVILCLKTQAETVAADFSKRCANRFGEPAPVLICTVAEGAA